MNEKDERILDFIVSAEDYGYASSFIFCFCAEMLDNQITGKNIIDFVNKNYCKEKGYAEEERNTAISILNEFKLNYLDK